MLLTWNNLAYYQHLMRGARQAIAEGTFEDFCAAARAGWATGDLPPPAS
jgi:queuine tRNA-ribosyltransferase